MHERKFTYHSQWFNPHCLIARHSIKIIRCFEVKSEKADSHWESNSRHLACAASALPLSYDITRQSLALTVLCIYVLHRWD